MDHEACMTKVAAYIDEHFTEDICLADVYTHACLSRCRFCRLFRAGFGCTFLEYLNGRRIDKAASLLQETNLPSYSIAMQCGFSSASYFTTVFRKQMGIPPARYRTRCKAYSSRYTSC